MIKYSLNKENGKRYRIEPDKYKQFPHLEKLKEEILKIENDSKEYWRLRCTYLEKAMDVTYSSFERDNCKDFYRLLVKKNFSDFGVNNSAINGKVVSIIIK